METSVLIPGLKESVLKACEDFDWKPPRNILLKWLKQDSLEYQQLMRISIDSKNIIVDSCLYGYVELISVFINNNFPVNSKIQGNAFCNTMLNIATVGRQLPLIKYLISHGADVNYVCDYGYTPLLCVFNTGHIRVTYSGNRPYPTVIKNSHIDVLKFLLEAGANVNCSCERGKLPLCCAVQFGDIDCVKMLIAYGTDVNKRDNFSNTPLFYAVKKQRPVIPIIELLLNAGACTEIVDAIQLTALHEAVEMENQNVIELLLERGANVNHKGFLNHTPLYRYIFINIPIRYSIVRGFVSKKVINIVGTLVLWGADVNISDYDGRNLLHWAALQGSIPLIKLLIGRGLDVKDKLGKKPIHCASEAGHHSVVQYFIDYYCNKLT